MTWLILFFYLNYNPISDTSICSWCWLCGAEGHVMGRRSGGECLGRRTTWKVHRAGPEVSDLKSHTRFMARPPSQALRAQERKHSTAEGSRGIHHVLVGTRVGGRRAPGKGEIPGHRFWRRKRSSRPLIQGIC